MARDGRLLRPPLSHLPGNGGAYCGREEEFDKGFTCVPNDPRYPTGACHPGVPISLSYRNVLRTVIGEFGVFNFRDTTVYVGDSVRIVQRISWPTRNVTVILEFDTTSKVFDFQRSAHVTGKEIFNDGEGHIASVLMDLQLLHIGSHPIDGLRPARRVAALAIAEMRADGLDLSGPPGTAVRARVFDPAGRTWGEWTWSGHARLPARELPKGLFFVALTPGGLSPTIRAFAR